MIISKNNDAFNQNTNFEKKFNHLKEQNDKLKLNKKNPFVEDIKTINYANPTNREEMRNKSLSMLQERLDKGLITLEEFKKKCNALRKDK